MSLFSVLVHEIGVCTSAKILIMTIGIQHKQSVTTIPKNLNASIASSRFLPINTGREFFRSLFMIQNILKYIVMINKTYKKREKYQNT